MTTTYVFVDTVNGSNPPSTKTHASASWPANSGRWANLNNALADATVQAVADDLVVYCQGATDDTTAVNVPAALSATSVTIVGDVSGAAWDASKYTVAYSGASSGALEVAVTAVTVTLSNLQISNTGSNGGPVCIRITGTGTNTLNVDSCHLRVSGSGTSTGYAVRQVSTTGMTIRCYNSIAQQTGSPGGRRDGFSVGTSATGVAYNCVAEGFNGTSANGIANFDTVTNCALFNNTNDCTSGTRTYCASDDITTGTGNIFGRTWVNEFEDYANGDFRLKAGSTLIGAGIADPGTGLFSDDIAGITRGAAWDIGAFEYVASSGLTITSVTPSSFDSGIAGIVIAGAGFGASQGSSTVDIGGQAQTVTAWTDTSITMTSARGSNSMGAGQLKVTIR